MDSEQYEILPHEELEALRKEVEYLKRNPLGDNKQADDLRGAIDQLSESIHSLIKLFTDVNKDMMEDFNKMTVENHFAHLSKQNETIAQGLLSIAEMVKKYHKEDEDKPAAAPAPEMGMPPGPVGQPPSGAPPGMVAPPIGTPTPGLAPQQSPMQGMPPPAGAMPPPGPQDHLNLGSDVPPEQQLAKQIGNEGYQMPPPTPGAPAGEPEKKKGLLRFK